MYVSDREGKRATRANLNRTRPSYFAIATCGMCVCVCHGRDIAAREKESFFFMVTACAVLL